MLTVMVAALGYFVDIYDLILFSIVRVPSLKTFGLSGEALTDVGVRLINWQMGGMLIGGILWGILGDKRGRLTVLFGSILTYSLANIANGFAQTVLQYEIMRFVAGIGLAGELGAGITLVAEVMPKEKRGIGTTVVAGVGILGAVVAALVGDAFSWRIAYFVGGGLGLGLLLVRVGVTESGMFRVAKASGVRHGDFFAFFRNGKRLRRYLAVITVGVPVWYAVGILVTFSPEIAKGMGLTELPKPSTAVMLMYIGLAIGDFGSGFLSHLLKSRKRVLAGFLGLSSLATVAYFTVGRTSLVAFYAVVVVLGVASGYWAVFVTVASEQFGTNIRATATTTAPNFVRGAVVIVTSSFQALKGPLGVVGSAALVGVVVLVLGFVSLLGLEETHGKDLDFVEE
ncbi:MAG: MFS transporter [Myxococcales bacterium]|nr:MFS transporter [Myxococcales bacterium]